VRVRRSCRLTRIRRAYLQLSFRTLPGNSEQPTLRTPGKFRLAPCNVLRPSYRLSIRCPISFRRPICSSNRRSCFLIRCRRSSICRRGRLGCFCLATGGILRQPTQNPLSLREEEPSFSWGLLSLYTPSCREEAFSETPRHKKEPGSLKHPRLSVGPLCLEARPSYVPTLGVVAVVGRPLVGAAPCCRYQSLHRGVLLPPL